MPRTVDCPNGGAPLELEDSARVVECAYCERHVVVADGSLTQKPAERVARGPAVPSTDSGDRRRRRGKAAQKTNMLVGGGVTVAILAVLFGYWMVERASAERASATPPVEQSFAKLELSSSSEELAALFGDALHSNQATADFRVGKVRRAELRRELSGNTIGHLTLYLRSFDRNQAIAKMQEIVRHRLRKQPSSHRLNVGDAVLDVFDGHIAIWHWTHLHTRPDDTFCKQRLNAFWALVRWAVFDGRTLTAEEQKLVNGTTLSESSGFDTSVTVEQASEAFQKKFESGWCRMQAGLTCVLDVDHEVVGQAHYNWSNGLRARLQQLKLSIHPRQDPVKAQRALAGCLQPVLGTGTETVVDYVRGTRNIGWKVGQRGDPIVLGTGELALTTAAEAPAEQPAGWEASLPKILSALDHCTL